MSQHEDVGFAEVGMGAEALMEVVKGLDLDQLAAELRDEVANSSGQRHIKATKGCGWPMAYVEPKIDPVWDDFRKFYP